MLLYPHRAAGRGCCIGRAVGYQDATRWVGIGCVLDECAHPEQGQSAWHAQDVNGDGVGMGWEERGGRWFSLIFHSLFTILSIISLVSLFSDVHIIIFPFLRSSRSSLLASHLCQPTLSRSSSMSWSSPIRPPS